MKILPQDQPLARPLPAWLIAALIGGVAPIFAMVMVANVSASLGNASGPILALGLMGTGMVAAAAVGRFWIGLGLALVTGVTLVLLARALGMPPLLNPLSIGLAVVVASVSFAARGALFARSAFDKGWLIALVVVAGEAAMLCTALAAPGLLPDWLLALLPAQWASTAILMAVTGTGVRAAGPVLIALAGTAATTLLVAYLLPRKWPYSLMFTAWLGLSALVFWHQSAPPMMGAPAESTARAR